MVGAGVVVAVGLLLLAVTLYQEKVAEPSEEDYHMGIPVSAKYEWRSRSVAVSVVGLGCVCFGAGLLIGFLIFHRP